MHTMCRERLMVWDFLCLEKGGLKEDLTAVYNYPMGKWREDGDAQWQWRCSRGNGCKLEHGQSQLDIRKLFFTITVLEHWRMIIEATESPSSEIFKTLFWSCPPQSKLVPMALQGLEPDGCHSPYQPELSDDSMIIPWVLVMIKRLAQPSAWCLSVGNSDLKKKKKKTNQTQQQRTNQDSKKLSCIF